MYKHFKGLALSALVAALIAAPASAAVFVSATTATPTELGTVVAGTFYTLTATGTANIYDAGQLDFDADGRPTHAIPAGAYAAFNGAGCCYSDPSSPGNFGPAGGNGFLGSLVGTYLAAPVSAADYFQLGASVHFQAQTSGKLYGLVNDANGAYGDNRANTGFSVSLAADAAPGGLVVPEPASWALMVLGFGGAGVALRRGRRSAVAAAG
ncbi:MAG: putative exosortase interaction domain protein [Phenylobacterium sp.]|nr:putative exosortase interaction domain protein [Phenylobacterium sp.]